MPRTGTTSLAKALEILDIDVIHHCPITNPSTREELNTDKYQAYVSSDFLISDMDLDKNMWIFLHRESWFESMWMLGQDTCDFQDHLISWKKIQNITGPNILHYRISDGWKPLCEFLKVAIPNQQFPHVNIANSAA